MAKKVKNQKRADQKPERLKRGKKKEWAAQRHERLKRVKDIDGRAKGLKG